MKIFILLSTLALASLVAGQQSNYPSKPASYPQSSYPRPSHKSPEAYKQEHDAYPRPSYKQRESYRPEYESPAYEPKLNYSPKPASYPVNKPAYAAPSTYEPKYPTKPSYPSPSSNYETKYNKPSYPSQSYENTPSVYEPKYNAKPQAYPGGYDQSYEPGMPFNFVWAVKDEYNYNDYSHASESDGKVTKGEYRTLLPDGRMQVVTYVADDYNGYNADVKYIGEAKPYEYKPSSYSPKPYAPETYASKPIYPVQESSYPKPNYNAPSPAYAPRPAYPANAAYPKPSYKPVESYQQRPSYPAKYPSSDKY